MPTEPSPGIVEHRTEDPKTEQTILSLLHPSDLTALTAIAEMQLRAWGRKPDPAKVEERASKLRTEVEALDPATKCLLAAYRDGNPVGFARVARDRDGSSAWWLSGIDVHPDFRRQGTGTRLARACVRYAKTRGATLLRSSAHDDNRTSIAFHQAFGFQNDGPFVAPDGDRKVAFSLPLA